ncbi:MAG: hypothetical protein KDE27_04780 [Planctomycetes bacterium]|nr:hypothetical protein [Planctomycetota bacterium]
MMLRPGLALLALLALTAGLAAQGPAAKPLRARISERHTADAVVRPAAKTAPQRARVGPRFAKVYFRHR